MFIQELDPTFGPMGYYLNFGSLFEVFRCNAFEPGDKTQLFAHNHNTIVNFDLNHRLQVLTIIKSTLFTFKED